MIPETALTSTSPTPIPLPTHHQNPSQLCHSTIAHVRFCNQLIVSSLTSTKFIAVLMIARITDPAPKTPVPPSSRHARLRLTMKPQMIRERLKMSSRVESNTFRMASPRSIEVRSLAIEVKTKPEAARARGPMSLGSATHHRCLINMRLEPTEQEEDQLNLRR